MERIPSEQPQQPGKRHLKIMPKPFPRSSNNSVIFPEIRLAGKYLEPLGFTIGKKVIVTQEPEKLTITLDSPEPDPDKQKADGKCLQRKMRALQNSFNGKQAISLDEYITAIPDAGRKKKAISKIKRSRSIRVTDRPRPIQLLLEFPVSP